MYTPPDETINNMIIMLSNTILNTVENLTVLGWKAFIYKANIPWQIQSWRAVILKKRPFFRLLSQSQPFISKKVGWTTYMLPLHEQFSIRENDTLAVRVDGAMPLYEHSCTGGFAHFYNFILNLTEIPIEKEHIQPGLIVKGSWMLNTCKMYSFELITRRQLPGKQYIFVQHHRY